MADNDDLPTHVELAQRIENKAREQWGDSFSISKIPPAVMRDAGATVAHAALAEMAGDLRNTPDAGQRKPRVWYAGDPEPDDDVQCVIDSDGDVWRRNRVEKGTWDGSLWLVLVRLYGPVTEGPAAQAPAASNPELEALRAKLRQAPAASEQPQPGDTVAVTWDDGHESEDTVRPSGYYTGANSVERGEATVRVTEQEWQDFDAALAECRGQRPAASEDTIEQAARMLATQGVKRWDALPEASREVYRQNARALAGLFADGTNRRRESLKADLRRIDELREEFRSDTDEYNGYDWVRGALEALRRVRAALTDTEDPAALTGGQP